MIVPIPKVTLLLNCLMVLAGTAMTSELRRTTPLPIDEMVQSSHFVGNLGASISPDGEWIALAIQKTRKHAPEQNVSSRFWFTSTGAPFEFSGTDIWIVNIQSGESKNLTEGKGISWGPSWSPDGHILAFSSDRGGAACLWIWEMSSGKLREIKSARVTNTPEALQWMPDSKHLVASVLPEGMSLRNLMELLQSGHFDPVNVQMNPHSAELQSSAVVMESDSASTFNSLLSDLAIIDITDGALRPALRKIRPLWWRVSPDGHCVAAMSVIRGENKQSGQVSYQLSMVNLRTGRSRILASSVNWKWKEPISWSPNSQALAYAAGNNRVFLAPMEGGEAHLLVPSRSDFSTPSALLWNADGSSIYAVTERALWQIGVAGAILRNIGGIPDRILISAVARQGENQLWMADGQFAILLARDGRSFREGFYKTDLRTGESTELWEESKVHRSAARLSETGEKVVYFAEDAQHPEDLWIMDINNPPPHQVTHNNPQFDGYALGETRLINWTSEDGEQLRGTLLLPAGFAEGTRYPLIVCVYGGQLLSSARNRWQISAAPLNLQLLATRGYAVLYPDAPQEEGTPLQDLAKSVLPGIQKVIDVGVADARRIGIIGYSYGGYSVLALLVQSKRFKAAVDVAGITNLMDAYAKIGTGGGAMMWVEQGQGQIGGSLWQYRERFIENSPFFYLDKVRTPLLIIHGSSDTIPVFEARLAFGALRRLGKEVVYVEYQGEEHIPILWTYVNQVNFCNRVISWFERYLKRGAEQGTKVTP